MRYGQTNAPAPARQPGTSQLIFRVSQWEFAIPSRLVRSIVPSPSILPMPGIPVWLVGLLQSGGAATPTIDIRVRLGFGTSIASAAVVVIEPPACPESSGSKNGKVVGLLVDKVLDTAMIRTSDVHAMRESSTLPFKDFLLGAWRGRSRACYLVDVGKLVPEDLDVHIQAIFSAFR